MKKAILSINVKAPIKGLGTGKHVIKALSENSELIVTTPELYDFRNRVIGAFKIENGQYKFIGNVEPKADIWWMQTDGYWINHSKKGFDRPLDFHEEQMQYFESLLEKGDVGEIVNHPTTERKTLKSYLSELQQEFPQIIHTYNITNIDELYELQKEKGIVVIKPIWGGARKGVEKISSKEQIKKWSNINLADYVVQDYSPGDEKRMWVLGGKFVEGRLMKGRQTPWSAEEPTYEIRYHNGSEAQDDINLTNKIAEKIGLNYGSVDFLGDKVNELNGAGTSFIGLDINNINTVHATKHLYKFIIDKLV